VFISVVIRELRTAAIIAIKLMVGVVSGGFITLSYISKCRLSCICLFVGVN
jgi:hypothetical protein